MSPKIPVRSHATAGEGRTTGRDPAREEYRARGATVQTREQRQWCRGTRQQPYCVCQNGARTRRRKTAGTRHVIACKPSRGTAAGEAERYARPRKTGPRLNWWFSTGLQPEATGFRARRQRGRPALPPAGSTGSQAPTTRGEGKAIVPQPASPKSVHRLVRHSQPRQARWCAYCAALRRLNAGGRERQGVVK